MSMQFNRWLLDRYRGGQTTVLVIDEAQNLSPLVLEEIRLLSNLETATEKLLQIVLSGYADGVPRVINLLCELALINAFVDQKRPVPAESVGEAAHDFQLDQMEASAPPANGAGTEAVPATELLGRELARILNRVRRVDPACAEPGAGKP